MFTDSKETIFNLSSFTTGFSFISLAEFIYMITLAICEKINGKLAKNDILEKENTPKMQPEDLKDQEKEKKPKVLLVEAWDM